MGVLVRDRLGRVCRLARRDATLTLLDLETATRLSVAQLSRFERGLAWPERFEEIVEIYERECRLGDGELWRRAVAREE